MYSYPAYPGGDFAIERLSIRDLVNRHLENLSSGDRNLMTWHPSTVGYCGRKTVMEALGFPHESKDGRAIRILDNGQDVHDRIQRYFRDMGILIADELALQCDVEDPEIRERCISIECDGHTDAVLDVNGQFLAELKSIGKGFAYVAKVDQATMDAAIPERIDILPSPLPDHIKQLTQYMWLTGIHHGILIYEEKLTQEWHELWVPYSETLGDKLAERARALQAYKKAGILPPREYEFKSFQCQWCSFRLACWGK